MPIKHHLGRQCETVFPGVEAADSVGETFRKHGHHLIGKIDTGPPLTGLQIQGRLPWHIVAHIRDVNKEADLTMRQGLDRDGVVKIPGLLSIDSDGLKVPEVSAAVDDGRGHKLRNSPCACDHLFGKGHGKGKLGHDHFGINLRIIGPAQNFLDPPFGISARGGILHDLGHDQIAVSGPECLVRGDIEVIPVPTICGDDESKLTVAGPLKPPHHLGDTSLKNPDDPSLPPSVGPGGLHAGHHVIAMHGVQQVPPADIDILLSGLIGDHKAIPFGVALETARHQVHFQRKPVAVALDKGNLARKDHFSEEPLELTPSFFGDA